MRTYCIWGLCRCLQKHEDPFQKQNLNHHWRGGNEDGNGTETHPIEIEDDDGEPEVEELDHEPETEELDHEPETEELDHEPETENDDECAEGGDDWGDLKVMEEVGDDEEGHHGKEATGDSRDWKSTENSPVKKETEKKNEGTKDDKKEEKEEDYETFSFDWSAIKQYDYDYDTNWINKENKKLEKKYGEYVKIKYNAQAKIAYFCELCKAEMNARQALDMHCAGMKHLKKVNQKRKEQEDEEEEEEEDVLVKMNKSNTTKYNRYSGVTQYDGKKNDSRDTAYKPRSQDKDWERKSDRRDRYRPEKRPRDNPYDDRRMDDRRSGPSSLGDAMHGILTRLAVSAIVSDNDAELAASVAQELLKLAKNYSRSRGDANTAELLMDAEMKLSAVKTLKLGLKYMAHASSRSGPRVDWSPPRHHFSSVASSSFGGHAPVSYPLGHLQSNISRNPW